MSELTAAAALKLVGEIFVYHMPFNRALGWSWSAMKRSLPS
jgi:hypothetical protein